jgi:hypothetical protein
VPVLRLTEIDAFWCVPDVVFTTRRWAKRKAHPGCVPAWLLLRNVWAFSFPCYRRMIAVLDYKHETTQNCGIACCVWVQSSACHVGLAWRGD